ncbi:MAG: radical SAM protein [Pseudaminobacter sp.]|nr:radical SAM protein [Pseudaminobacter sp.]
MIKFSKFCNLRCGYCYEWDNLSSKARISLDDLPKIFEKILAYSSHFKSTPKICWHGGEPLMLGEKYIREAMAIMKAAAPDVPHLIQTNLYQKVDGLIDTLRLFDHVSVSLDLFTSDRFNIRGEDSHNRVVENLDLLRSNGIAHGLISVLNSKNHKDTRRAYQFVKEALVPIRFLPFYRKANSEQVEDYGLTGSQLLDAFQAMAQPWLDDGRPIYILPLHEYLCAAENYVQGAEKRVYDKSSREHIMVVDTSGEVYAVADTYDPKFSYGNLITDDVEAILNSSGRRGAINDSMDRVLSTCISCEFAGSCSTFPVAEATPIERRMFTHDDGCTVAKGMIQFFVDAVRQRRTEVYTR